MLSYGLVFIFRFYYVPTICINEIILPHLIITNLDSMTKETPDNCQILMIVKLWVNKPIGIKMIDYAVLLNLT